MLIVITCLDQLASSERWSRLIDPLAIALQESGLGELPDLAGLRGEFHDTGVIEATEVAVRLKNFDYGRELVDRLIADAGLDGRRYRQPERWREYNCDNYFSSLQHAKGYWDERGQYGCLSPFDQVFENEASAFLDIGGAGFDGIRFGYRRCYSGIWAYPVDGAFVFLADTLDSFLHEWLSGRITL